MKTLESFGNHLYRLRSNLQLSIRELCRHTERRDVIPETISPTYYSRLERGGTVYCCVEKTSIDKIWALGVVLKANPLDLFCRSRGLDLDLAASRYQVFDSLNDHSFGLFLRNRRNELGLSLRSACELTENTDFKVSIGYWSQFETDFREQSSKISGDKLLGVAYALNTDPLLLYVLSRKLPARYLLKKNRDMLFS